MPPRRVRRCETVNCLYEYFPTDMKKLKTTWEFGATMIYAVKTEDSINLMAWLVLCALEKDCMAPPGAQLKCKFGDSLTSYAYCHRYDQAVLNLLLANAYGFDIGRYVGGPTYSDVGFHRTPSDTLKPENFSCTRKS
ncbi:hypothetical protein Q1695_005587 [Nippostrongylus brasiliensis]|nr:hypothetical protein Q1695_005587 [Nippostrongylus brasiliensis]